MRGMNRTRQHGVTLIGMMVGLVISMVVILAMLTVYKTTLRVTGETGWGAATDGQRLAALFAAQTLLQEAGYGITAAAFGTDLVVLSGATLGNQLTGTVAGALPANGNAIVWGSKTASTYMCNGLYAPASGGLIRLPATGCAAATSWNSINWKQVVLVQDDTADRAVSIQVTHVSSCQPFGISGTGSLMVKLQTKNSTSTGRTVTATTCLSNF